MMLRADWDSFKALNKVLEEDHHLPGSIARACAELEACLHANKDNVRAFFEQCFPLLLKRVFGYHDFEVSWLNAVTAPGRELDCKALTALLDPNGKLFAAMHSADADQRIQFIFPLERLPAHTQALLKTPQGRRELDRWPQYRARVRADAAGRIQVQLNIFQYFMSWTAFYVLRGSRGPEGLRAQRFNRMRYRPDLTRLGSNLLPGLLHPHAQVAGPHHLYLDLLVMYLDTYLPQHTQDAPRAAQAQGLYSPQAKRPTYSPTEVFDNDASPGDVLFSVLLEFWLTDSSEPPPLDAAVKEPMPSPQAGSSPAITSPSPAPTPMSSRTHSYQPPSEELVKALQNFARYINVDEGPNKPPKPAQYGAAWLPTSPIQTFPPPQGRLLLPVQTTLLHGPVAAPAYQLFSRKLYRFLRRAFSQWPASSTTPLLPILNLWMQQLAPWQRTLFTQHTQQPSPPPTQQPFDSGMPGMGLGHQLTRSLSMSHQKPQAPSIPPLPAQRYSREWRMHVLANLPFYLLLVPRYTELLASQAAFRADATLHDLLLLLQFFSANRQLTEELQALEEAVNNFTKSQPRRAEGEFAEILPWLLDQAHDFEVAATVAIAGGVQLLVADPQCRMFGTDDKSTASHVQTILEVAASQGANHELLVRAEEVAKAVLPMSSLPSSHTQPPAPPHLKSAHFPRPGDWRKVHYRGSSLRRPICSYEWPLLVKLTVWASESLNNWLGLDQPYDPDYLVESRLDQLWQVARRKQWHVNLRWMADTKLLLWLLCFVLVLYVLRLLGV